MNIEKNNDVHAVSKKLIEEIGEVVRNKIASSLMTSIHKLLIDRIDSGETSTQDERKIYVEEFLKIFAYVFFKDLLGFKTKKSKSKIINISQNMEENKNDV